MTNYQEYWPTPEDEQIRNKEVFTNDVAFIGPNSPEAALEALPVLCSVITFGKPEEQKAGMLHTEHGITQEDATDLLREAQRHAQSMETDLSQYQIHAFNVGQIPEQVLQRSFHEVGLILPHTEMMAKPGIRLEKMTGSIRFFDP